MRELMMLALAIAIAGIGFTEMRSRTGIDFVNVSGDEAKQYIVSSLGGGAVPWCINTGKSLIPLTLLFLHQKRNLLIHTGNPPALPGRLSEV